LNVEDIDLDLVSINPLKAELEYISHADLQTLELIKAAIGNRFYLSYEESKAIVLPLNLSGREEFDKKHKELNLSTKGVPGNPENFYKRKGTWIDWYDFLGKYKPEYTLSYGECKKVIQHLNLSSREEFRKKHKELNLITKGVPASPPYFYKRKWTWLGWSDFLRNEKKPEYTLSYEECKEIVQHLNISGIEEFDKKHKELNLSTKGVPKDPKNFYKKRGTWLGWPDFLRNERKPDLSYEECKEIVQSLNIGSIEEFKQKHKELNLSAKGVPKCPEGSYISRGTWKGRYDFLGKHKPEYELSYEECKKIVQSLNLSSVEEFFKKHKELNLSTKGIPKDPQEFYKRKGTWIDWPDFLGKTKHKRRKNKDNGG
jgi:uncharacterized protein YpiB (UPF0302 family)